MERIERITVNGFGERIERMMGNGLERIIVNGFGERIERMMGNGLGRIIVNGFGRRMCDSLIVLWPDRLLVQTANFNRDAI